MKRLKALAISFILSIFLSSFILTSYSKNIDKDITVKNNSIKYNTLYSKYNSYDVLTKNIDENTILLMGSSELVATLENEEHPKHLLDYSDKNIMQIGGGHYQSLLQSIVLGSIGSDIPVKKVNLIISMQWFEKNGIAKEAFESRVSLDHLYHFFGNKNISNSTKEKMYNRIKNLTDSTSFINSTLDNIFSPKFFNNLINPIFKYKYNLQEKRNFVKKYKYDSSVNCRKFNGLNWDVLEEKAIERAKKETYNNKFYIENEYYNEYIRNDLKKYEGYMNKQSYSESPEYEDLELFINVAKELGYEVNLIMIPLQGYWADYTGISKDSINEYYDKIKKIASENEVQLTDYSMYSYKPYFFKDIMHLGRLGFLQLQKDLLENED
ncbi:D-alanyl-lipoteichoic acid biosynthesis protein DltD [Parvimonas sp. D2]|uniref:D-alanyl-lipoteichoic acid biosynthesis protein DltD n=1 Tax=unclassified Parvimonas TaxID=1151464 RepID=UPI001CB5DC22|nr:MULTISPECIES: D-alanyl-lipoteichoic acid biosynthesis protein DltD [unclassified Parvimonas]MBF1294511.1 D-alanyl-lipoteichoic acid biosynthesis protein DltD [Parvimonas sp.]MEB3011725.1 D-alanyl-lipoteichoic acid biosynthesis protein DltD [Parvimonas sp. D2]MEB3087217.1 D-alanyl-lipoteichoic acid biosynthesis protein DltD [Parvimonas sp. D4]